MPVVQGCVPIAVFLADGCGVRCADAEDVLMVWIARVWLPFAGEHGSRLARTFLCRNKPGRLGMAAEAAAGIPTPILGDPRHEVGYSGAATTIADPAG